MDLISLHQLRLFVSVARERSFSDVAAALRMSQPSVSIQIRELEKRFGAKLLNRVRGTVKLTPEGEIVFHAAESIFNVIANAQTEIANLRGLQNGRLAVAGNAIPSITILPAAIAGFRRDHPGIEVSLKVGRSDEVELWIGNGEVDFGVISGDPVSRRMITEDIGREQRLLILPPAHRLTANRSVQPKALSNELFLLPDSPELRTVVQTSLAKKGVRPQITTFGTTNAILAAIRNGLGVSILAKSIVAGDLRQRLLVAKPIHGLDFTTRIRIIRHLQAHLSPAATAFLNFLRSKDRKSVV